MITLLYALISIATFFFMEFMAWFTHKYIMHGFLWILHEDHHRPHDTFFEKNDAFFVIFALPSFLSIWLGFIYQNYFSVSFGFGILIYGICYFLVHDVLIHQRFKWFRNMHNVYFTALRKAHKIHHKKMVKEDGECFGMLIVPNKYFEESKKYHDLRNAG